MPVLVIATIPLLLAAMIALTPEPPRSRWADDAERLGIEPVDLFWGEMTYRNTCAVCHGADGEGVPRLGKPLRNSAFVQSSTDEELFAQVAEGRPANAPENTTGVPMPARGGNPALTDERVRDVVQYLRTLQEPGAPTVPLDAWIVEKAVPSAGASPVAGGADPRDVIGHDSYIASCSACHGADAAGLPGLGKALKGSAFVAEKSDAELLAFVKQGRPIWDAENTTGVDMPPKGGNPALGDEEIKQIIAYLRAIDTRASGDGARATEGSSAPASGSASGTGGVFEQAWHDSYIASCSACHGADAAGLPGLGKALKGSAFVAEKSDAELLAFVKQGRPIWDAENTTGVDMPPKGGNPALGDEEIKQIIAYLRAIDTD